MKAKRKRRLGDRGDGWLLRGIDPYDSIIPYIMSRRNDSQNLFQDKFEITNVEKYLREKKDQGYRNFGILHVLLAAYVRTVSQRPKINRFVAGQKIYARNDIEICMAVKRELRSDETNTVIKTVFSHEDTAIDVYNKFNKVYENATSQAENHFDGTARIINYIPGLLKKFTVGFLAFLDYFGILPKGLSDVSCFHGSMFITSMGSLGIPPIYHHLYNFGNIPVFVAFGTKRRVMELDESGNPVKRTYVDYNVVTDERICDGFAYASAFKLFRRYMNNPWMLDNPPEEVIEDPNIDAKRKKKKENAETAKESEKEAARQQV